MVDLRRASGLVRAAVAHGADLARVPLLLHPPAAALALALQAHPQDPPQFGEPQPLVLAVDAPDRAGFVLLKLASLPDRPGPSAVRALSPATVGAGVHRRAYRLRQDRAGGQEPDGYPHLQPLPPPQVFRGELRRRDRAA